MFGYNIGTVVKNNVPNKYFVESDSTPVYGHVTGFCRTKFGGGFQTILLVRWDTGEEGPIHPGNVLTKEDH